MSEPNPTALLAQPDLRCWEPRCPDFGDPDFGEGTCPASHAHADWTGCPFHDAGLPLSLPPEVRCTCPEVDRA